MSPRTGITILVIASLLGFGGLAYWQYRKLRYGYSIKVRKQPLTQIIRNISADGATLSLTLDITNPSAYDAKVKNYNFDIFLNGINVGNITSAVPFYLKPNSTTPLTFNLAISFKSHLKLTDLFTLLQQDLTKVIVDVKGYMNISAYGIEINNLAINYSDNLKSLVS